MKKALLGLFILFDLALIGGSSYMLYLQFQKYQTGQTGVMSSPAGTPSATNGMTPAVSTSTAKLSSNSLDIPPAGESTARKILFSYRNSRSRQVAIRADFTGWKAEPMTKDAKGNWTYLAHLSPGEYAYCYTADDKTFKDPANKRTKQIGRTLVSAILVEALSAKPPVR